MGVLDSIKNIFSSDDHERNEQWIEKANDYTIANNDEYNEDNFKIDIIDIAPNLYLAHRAGRICVGKKPIQGTMNDRMVHVEKMLNQHHESVTEHTNVILLMTIPYAILKERATGFSEFMSYTKYCHVTTNDDIRNHIFYVLIGGSARAFYYLIRESR